MFGFIYRWLFGQLQLDNLTLDLDSTVMTRYGRMEGAAKGYNPRKPGRLSHHHPLMAFVADTRMIANFWLFGQQCQRQQRSGVPGQYIGALGGQKGGADTRRQRLL